MVTKKVSTKEKKAVKKPVEKTAKKKKVVSPKKKTVLSLPQKKFKPDKYYEAVGRRKTSVARVRIFTKGEKVLTVNDKPYASYFTTLELQQIADAALNKMKSLDRFRVSVKVRGGGMHSQAEAVRFATARALSVFNPDYRKRLKKAGYLTRDPRMKERKKFGLKKARKAPQWQKR